jgi:hypothetical protein
MVVYTEFHSCIYQLVLLFWRELQPLSIQKECDNWQKHEKNGPVDE